MTRPRCAYRWFTPGCDCECARPPAHEGMHMCYCGNRARQPAPPPAPQPVITAGQEVLW
jgi:hypothetical protein